jgi:glutamine synthetase
VNPYLTLAAILGAALVGIEDGAMPPDPVKGNAYALDLPQIPADWPTAVTAFENSTVMPRIFNEELIRNLVLTKKQEIHYMDELTPAERVEIYLDTV